MTRWTAEEDTTLIKLWKQGWVVDFVAEQLGRTRKSIWRRVHRLRRAGQLPPPALAYLPGETTVPCPVCGYVFAHIRVTQKYCSLICTNVANRVQEPTMRKGGLCPRCGEGPRPTRSDGTLRGWCRPCESAQKVEYMKTDAGKAVLKRYAQSEKGKSARRAAMERYLATEKGQAALRRKDGRRKQRMPSEATP
jgi:hypothetical protein